MSHPSAADPEDLTGGDLRLLEPAATGPSPISPAPESGGIPAVRRLPDDVGAPVLVRHGDRVLITASPQGDVPETAPPALSAQDLAAVDTADLTEQEALGLEAFRLRTSAEFAEAKRHRPRQDEPWDMVSCAPQTGPVRLDDLLGETEAEAPPDVAAPPIEGLNDNLEGPVGLAVVFVSGPGAALTITAAERATFLAEVQEGTVWLAGANPSAHVSFSIETHAVTLAVTETAGLPEDTWRNAAMTALGYPGT